MILKYILSLKNICMLILIAFTSLIMIGLVHHIKLGENAFIVFDTIAIAILFLEFILLKILFIKYRAVERAVQIIENCFKKDIETLQQHNLLSSYVNNIFELTKKLIERKRILENTIEDKEYPRNYWVGYIYGLEIAIKELQKIKLYEKKE